MVLAIIVIITSIIAPTTTDIFGTSNIIVISREISVDLYYAQQKAIEESSNWIVEFTQSGYLIYPEGEQDEPRVIKDITENNVVFGDVSDEFSPVGEVLIYNSLGAPSMDLATIAIRNSRGKTLYLIISDVTGKIDIVNSLTE